MHNSNLVGGGGKLQMFCAIYGQLVGLSFLFIEMKELCEARVKLEMSSNFQIYLGKTDDYPPSPPLPPHSKLPEPRVNSLLINAVNESPFETVN